MRSLTKLWFSRNWKFDLFWILNWIKSKKLKEKFKKIFLFFFFFLFSFFNSLNHLIWILFVPPVSYLHFVSAFCICICVCIDHGCHNQEPQAESHAPAEEVQSHFFLHSLSPFELDQILTLTFFYFLLFFLCIFFCFCLKGWQWRVRTKLRCLTTSALTSSGRLILRLATTTSSSSFASNILPRRSQSRKKGLRFPFFHFHFSNCLGFFLPPPPLPLNWACSVTCERETLIVKGREEKENWKKN